MALIRLTRICWLCRGFNEIAQKMMKVLGCHQVQSQARCYPNFGRQVTGIQNQFSERQAYRLVHLPELDDHIGSAGRDRDRLNKQVFNFTKFDGFAVRQGLTPQQISVNKAIASPGAFMPNSNLEAFRKQLESQSVNLNLNNQRGVSDD